MKVTRRRLAEVAGGSALAFSCLAQTAADSAKPPAAGTETDLLQAARDNNKRLSDTLAKYEIPFSTEPAFQFKA